MGVVTVDVYTLDTTLAHDPIAGALVRIFDDTGTTFITSGTTDGAGKVSFGLNGTPSPAPTRYQARCSKLGVSFTNPEYIDVYDPLPALTTNKFNIYGNIHEVENALNPRMCRASGFFYDPGGRPLEDLLIKFTNLFDPVVVDGIVIATKVEVRTDKNGWAVVELLREGKYVATVSGMQDERLDIIVPDRAGVRFADLLYPVVAEIVFTPPPPWTVIAGQHLDVGVEVICSSYAVLDPPADADVAYASLNPSIATVVMQPDKIRINGVSVGGTTMEVTRRDNTIRRIPDSPIVGTGGPIVVT